MIYLFPQIKDTVPFFLQREVIANVDTIPENQFLAYEFLPLDSSKLLYDFELFNYETVFTGLPALVRPFVEQHGSALFLVFAILFVLSSLIFIESGRALFGNLRYIFTFGNRTEDIYGEQITTSDVWGHLFFILQTIVVFSILFFDLTIKHSPMVLEVNESLILFSFIMGAVFLFLFIKYVVYRIMGAVFSDSSTNILLDTYLWIVYLTGILGFLPILLFIYIDELKLYALILICAIFIVSRIIIIAKSYFLFVNSHIGILYYFVYLCAVEIMPYLLVYKAISFII